jgi:hypothetical protein
MRTLRHGPAWLTGLLLAGAALPARADAPPDPLRLVPAQADLFLQVRQPRRLLERFTSLPAFRQAQQMQVVREFYDSTNARRFYQFLAYLEKRLGADRMELLDRLAGGGAVLAVKVGVDPPPVLLVVQGKDERLMREFVKVAEEIVNQELARQENPVRVARSPYRGTEILHVADKAYAARVGSALLLSNKEQALKLALDLNAGAGKGVADNPGIAAARKMLPPRPLAWVWLNVETVRNLEQVKVAVPQVELNPVLGPFVASWIDTARRSSFLCACLAQEGKDFLATVRLPRGRSGMGPTAAVYLPPGDEPAPPLLEPKNVQYTASYYLDLGRLWKERDHVLGKEARVQLEKFEKNSGRFLGGVKLGKLLSQAGSHQRFLQTVQPEGTVYKKQPKQPVSAFAVVQEMRDPAFAKSMDGILRTVALFGAFQFNVKMVTEEHAGCKIVSYRFPEGRTVKGDKDNVRYNFSPAFVKVGDQFVVTSTVELARELVDLLQKEAGRKTTTASSVHAKVYASGVAAGLKATQDQLVTQLVLGQALSPAEAREQVAALFRLVEGLGRLDVESVYGPNSHRVDLRFTLGK